MSELKNVLSILKLGTTTGSFPIYGNYVRSDNKILSTHNLDQYVSIAYDFPLQGAVNLFVLNNTISNLNDDTKFVQKKDKLKITNGGFTANLNIIDDLDMPVIDLPDIPMVEIDEELLKDLKLASKFTGTDKYSNVYFGNDCIMGTDGQKVFYKKIKVGNPVGLDKTIISVMQENMMIGSNDENVVLTFDIGYILSTAYSIENFPMKKIRAFVEESNKGIIKLCNIAVLQDAIQKLSPIFFGEKEQIINIVNKNNKLGVIAESELNGKSVIEYESEMLEGVNIFMNSGYLKGVPLDFNVFVNPDLDTQKRLYLDNDVSSIVLMGLGEG